MNQIHQESPLTLARRLADQLTARGETLAIAEGATGGALANLLTGVPGSSAWFRAGIVAYSDYPKQLLLRVSTETIQEKGSISAEATAQMARLTRRLFGTTWAVALTGYSDDRLPATTETTPNVPATNPADAPRVEAPPSAPQAGLTFLALAHITDPDTPEQLTWEERLLDAPNRDTYKQEAAAAALELLLEALQTHA